MAAKIVTSTPKRLTARLLLISNKFDERILWKPSFASNESDAKKVTLTSKITKITILRFSFLTIPRIEKHSSWPEPIYLFTNSTVAISIRYQRTQKKQERNSVYTLATACGFASSSCYSTVNWCADPFPAPVTAPRTISRDRILTC